MQKREIRFCRCKKRAGFGHGAPPGGEAWFTTTTSACSPGSLSLKHGQDVLVVAGVQLPVNRGGRAIH